MICDCRLSNEHFVEPSGVDLCSGEALAALELDEGDELCVAEADLSDAFHHLEMPPELRAWFSLKRVRAGEVGVTSIGGKAVAPWTWIVPRLRVVPMGWTWALWWCQSVHTRIAARAGFEKETRVLDRHAAPSVKAGCHVIYVDNFIPLCTSASSAEEHVATMMSHLTKAKLVVKLENPYSNDPGEAQVLGWGLRRSPPRVRPLVRRLWRTRLAVRGVCAGLFASGDDIERLMGHIIFVTLVRREGLIIFDHCFAFIRRFGSRRVRLWPSVIRELEMWDGIAPLLFMDLSKAWHDVLHVVDASPDGCGVCSSTATTAEARDLGRHAERWRFKLDDRYNTKGARERAGASLAASVAAGVASSADGVLAGNLEGSLLAAASSSGLAPTADRKWKEVSVNVLKKPWRVVNRSRWKNKEASMPVLESRSCLHAVKHVVRTSRSHGKHIVILGDSLTVGAVMSRWRASTDARELLRVSRGIAAHLLATNITLHYRWIPSEWNPADGPSRSLFAASRLKPLQFKDRDVGPRVAPIRNLGLDMASGARSDDDPAYIVGGPTPQFSRNAGRPSHNQATLHQRTSDPKRGHWSGTGSDSNRFEAKAGSDHSTSDPKRGHWSGTGSYSNRFEAKASSDHASGDCEATFGPAKEAYSGEQGEDGQGAETQFRERSDNRNGSATKCGGETGASGIHQGLQRFSRLAARQQAACKQRSNGRRSNVRENGRVVLGRSGKHRNSEYTEGLGAVLQRLPSQRSSAPSWRDAGSEGMAKSFADDVAPSLPKRSDRRLCDGVDARGSLRRCPRSAGHFRDVPAPWRDRPHQRKPAGAAGAKLAKPPLVRYSPESGGSRRHIENFGVRQCAELRPCAASTLGSGPRRNVEAASEQEGRKAKVKRVAVVQDQVQGAHTPAAAISSGRKTFSTRPSPPLSLSSLSSVSRFRYSGKKPGGSATARSVASVEQRAQIRKGCEAYRADAPAEPRLAKIRSECKPGSGQRRCWPAFSPSAPVHDSVFLAIDCSDDRLGRRVASLGVPVLLWNVKGGPAYSLSDAINQRKICDWIRSGRVVGIVINIDGATWSRARDRAPGPAAVRSDLALRGLPNLVGRRALEVESANIAADFVARVC